MIRMEISKNFVLYTLLILLRNFLFLISNNIELLVLKIIV